MKRHGPYLVATLAQNQWRADRRPHGRHVLIWCCAYVILTLRIIPFIWATVTEDPIGGFIFHTWSIGGTSSPGCTKMGTKGSEGDFQPKEGLVTFEKESSRKRNSNNFKSILSCMEK